MGDTYHEAHMLAQAELEHEAKPLRRFEVALYKPVSDVLRAFVTVEARTPEEAESMALELDMSEIDFQFHACGDNPDPITAEATDDDDGELISARSTNEMG